MDTAPLSPEWQARIKRELRPSEKVRWAGQPVPQYFMPGSTIAFVLGLLGIGVDLGAIWYINRITGTGGFSPMALLPLPFLPFGFLALFAPLLEHWRARHVCCYAITDRRAIVFGGVFTATIKSYQPNQLHYVYRRERRNGIGDVVIEREAWEDCEGDTHVMEWGFIRIRNAQAVERMLKELARTSKISVVRVTQEQQ